MMKFVLFLLLPIYDVYGDCKQSPTTVSGSHAPKNVCSGELIFEEKFDKIDNGIWQHEQTLGGGGNGEFQWYSDDPKNSYVQDGKLHIKPTLLTDEHNEDFLYSGTIEIPPDKCTNKDNNGCKRTGNSRVILNPIKSARLNTVNSFAFKFGKMEVRAKVPAGDWLWPAIWLLPKDWKYGGWPRSGEIDVMESRGNRQLYAGNKNIGVDEVACTLHWGPDPAHNQWEKTHYEKNLNGGFDKDFHKYQLEWTPEHIQLSIDDAVVGTVTPPGGGFWELGNLQQTGMQNLWTNSKMAPFDQNFYIILNLAIGGTSYYFPDNTNNVPGPRPWSNAADNAMTTFWQGKGEWLPTWKMNTDDSHLQVDYVKVWAL
ncbi:unnamed protein product [Phyllotreta striolata]|uniref:GH16 domain-containing protein n=1 Tax=Phyllotreta striolata TaxID=444603 RepID=A0A9N9TGZ7_PHYSR|nr:unnamed protein product [Phyllotreta striolata]